MDGWQFIWVSQLLICDCIGRQGKGLYHLRTIAIPWPPLHIFAIPYNIEVIILISRPQPTSDITRTRTYPTFWSSFVRTYLPTPTRPYGIFKSHFLLELSTVYQIFVQCVLELWKSAKSAQNVNSCQKSELNLTVLPTRFEPAPPLLARGVYRSSTPLGHPAML